MQRGRAIHSTISIYSTGFGISKTLLVHLFLQFNFLFLPSLLETSALGGHVCSCLSFRMWLVIVLALHRETQRSRINVVMTEMQEEPRLNLAIYSVSQWNLNQWHVQFNSKTYLKLSEYCTAWILLLVATFPLACDSPSICPTHPLNHSVYFGVLVSCEKLFCDKWNTYWILTTSQTHSWCWNFHLHAASKWDWWVFTCYTSNCRLNIATTKNSSILVYVKLTT